MSLATVLLILAAIAAGEAIAAFASSDPDAGLAMMVAILMIAGALVLLDLSSTAMVAIQPPVG